MIASIATPWNNYKGKRVEDFIKKTFGEKVGCIKVVTGSDGTSNVVAGFATEDDYLEWMSLSDDAKWGDAGAAFLIAHATLPSIEQSDRRI